MVELNRIYECDIERGLSLIPGEFVNLIVTSPPYNAGKSYEKELGELEYYEFVLKLCKEFYRILRDDGRFCINVTFNINRRSEDHLEVLFPYIQWIKALIDSGLNIKEDIIWDQKNSGCGTQWGSWRSPSAPHIQHVTERIIIGYKNRWKLYKRGESDISPEEFIKFTSDLWSFNSEMRRNHPAPFPEELPYRCLKLFSWQGDIVLDPFMGSGTTGLVCKKLNRNYIGIDNNHEYVEYARKRIDMYSSEYGIIEDEDLW
jgi:DNA modification methylase